MENAKEEVNIEISVVIPVYKASGSLNELYERLSEVLDNLCGQWEIIMIDDGSPDDSYEIMEDLRRKDKRVKIIQFGRNQGQLFATLCGLKHSKGKYVFTMDADLQHPPEELPKFIRKFNEGYEVVIGRYGRKKHSFIRNLGSFLVQKVIMTEMLGKPEDIFVGSFKGFTRRAVDIISKYEGRQFYLARLIFESIPHNFITNVEVEHSLSKLGESTYTWGKLFGFAFHLFTNHLHIPLRFMIFWGCALTMASFLSGFYLLLNLFLSFHAVPSWLYPAVIISFLSGNILIALGIVGEYLERLLRNITEPEQFSIFRKEVD